MSEHCETCTYFDSIYTAEHSAKLKAERECDPPNPDAIDLGRCRRYPPTYKSGDGDDYSDFMFPLVEHVEWCGEFRSRMLTTATFHTKTSDEPANPAATLDAGIGWAGALMGMYEVNDPEHLVRMIRESWLSSGAQNVAVGVRTETAMGAFGAGYVAGVLASAGALRQEASALPCAEDACVTNGNAEHVLRYVGLIPPLD